MCFLDVDAMNVFYTHCTFEDIVTFVMGRAHEKGQTYYLDGYV